MPIFKVGGSFGYAGTHWEDEWEAETLEEAEKMCRDYMMERIEWWAKPIEDNEEEGETK